MIPFFVLLFTLTISVAWRFLPHLDVLCRASSFWLWSQLILFIFIVLPRRVWLNALAVLSAVTALLVYSCSEKIKLINFPTTSEDLKLVFLDPVGFLDALGVSRTIQIVLMIVCLGIFVFWFRKKMKVYKVRFAQRQGSRAQILKKVGFYFLLSFLAIINFNQFYTQYGDYVYNNRKVVFWGFRDRLWSDDGMIRIEQHLGLLGFLAYSDSLSRQSPKRFSELPKNFVPADHNQIRAAVEKYFKFDDQSSQKILPNIVFVLAESTFDPNVVFNLTKPFQNKLFQPQVNSLGGLLHVMTVGGGTWKSEFETITGLDARMFGFAGQYTHVSLSPYVKDSLPIWLKKKGYVTKAYYGAKGNFYGARSAYWHYGFDQFYDSVDLGIDVSWTKFSDSKMAEIVATKLPDDLSQPFFSYVVFLQNHSPHPCEHFSKASEFVTKFVGDADFNLNCQFNEYLKRTHSTEVGFQDLVARLQEIEVKTGRPYIAVIFGDHQPHTFTAEYFDGYRKPLGKFYTFYQIAKSDSIKLPQLKGAFHTTLLTSLVSLATAQNTDDVFLPENFYLYDNCGDVADPDACQELPVLAEPYKKAINY